MSVSSTSWRPMTMPTTASTPRIATMRTSRISTHSSSTLALPVRSEDGVDEPPPQRPGDDAGDDVIGEVAHQVHDQPRLVRALLIGSELADFVQQRFEFIDHEKCSPGLGLTVQTTRRSYTESPRRDTNCSPLETCDDP